MEVRIFPYLLKRVVMLNKEDKKKQDLNWINVLGSSKYYYIDDEQYKDILEDLK